jgi:hypothetical protein
MCNQLTGLGQDPDCWIKIKNPWGQARYSTSQGHDMAGPQMIITIQHLIIDLKWPPINPTPPQPDTAFRTAITHIHAITIRSHVHSPPTKLARSITVPDPHPQSRSKTLGNPSTPVASGPTSPRLQSGSPQRADRTPQVLGGVGQSRRRGLYWIGRGRTERTWGAGGVCLGGCSVPGRGCDEAGRPPRPAR